MRFQQLVERAIAEQAIGTTVGDFLQSRIHESFTVAADKIAQLGIVTVEERIAISSAIGDALQVFRDKMEEKAASAVDKEIPADVLMLLTFNRK